MKLNMFRFLSNIPIFRRIFIAFALAAIVPGVVLVLLTSFFLNSLNTQSQAVSISFDAQTQAAQQQQSLQRMNAILQTRFTDIFATLQGGVHDPSLSNTGGLIGSDIAARQGEFTQALATYQSDFELATSSNMSTIRNILISNDPNEAATLITGQQQALDAVAGTGQTSANQGLWTIYQGLQTLEMKKLDALDPTLQPNGQIPQLTSIELNQRYEDAYKVLWEANNAFTELKNSWNLVADDAATIGVKVTAVGPSQIQPVLAATAIALFSILLIVIVTGYIVNLTITQPLRQLASLTKKITKGDTSARARISSRDEIATVANSMNNMLDNIVHLIQDAQAQRDILQGQVEKLVSEVSGVGEGDLRVQAEVTADALGVLADSFNYMVEELGSLVVRVKMVAREVESSTTMTFERMTQLVEEADLQIRQIAEAAIEIERMAGASRQVAERAQVLYSGAREARLIAESGRGAVQQTIEGITRVQENVQETSSKVQVLGERSREINNIVEVISNIAHSTNRLALDAAIQAAMAGENGKGFGAVAADIRRLAERAKEQANSIGRIVRSVRDDIGAVAVSMRDTERETAAGAKLAEEAGTSLGSIFSVIERQASEIEVINSMVLQQQASSNAVVQIMHGVSESTQQSSTSTREAAQNMERLARLAEQLLASVEAFKLRENLNYYAPASSVTVTPENDLEKQLTVSGVFRTITASAQPSDAGGSNTMLAPAGSGAGYSPYTLAPFAQATGAPYSPQPYLPQGNGTPYSPSPQYPAQGNGYSSPPQYPTQQGNGYSSPPQYPSQGNGAPYSPAPQYPPQSNGAPYTPPPQGNGKRAPRQPRPPERPQWPNSDWQ